MGRAHEKQGRDDGHALVDEGAHLLELVVAPAVVGRGETAHGAHVVLALEQVLPDRDVGFQVHVREPGLDLEDLPVEHLQGVPVLFDFFHGCTKIRIFTEMAKVCHFDITY